MKKSLHIVLFCITLPFVFINHNACMQPCEARGADTTDRLEWWRDARLRGMDSPFRPDPSARTGEGLPAFRSKNGEPCGVSTTCPDTINTVVIMEIHGKPDINDGSEPDSSSPPAPR